MTGKRDLYYDSALELFLDGRTVSEIADLLPVSRKQIGEWCHDDGWVAMRREIPGSTRAMQRKLRAILHQRIQSLDIDTAGSGVADELYKFWKIIHDHDADSEDLMKSYRIDIMVEFLQYCHKQQGLDHAAQHDLINGFLSATVEDATA